MRRACEMPNVGQLDSDPGEGAPPSCSCDWLLRRRTVTWKMRIHRDRLNVVNYFCSEGNAGPAQKHQWRERPQSCWALWWSLWLDRICKSTTRAAETWMLRWTLGNNWLYNLFNYIDAAHKSLNVLLQSRFTSSTVSKNRVKRWIPGFRKPNFSSLLASAFVSENLVTLHIIHH